MRKGCRHPGKETVVLNVIQAPCNPGTVGIY